MPGLAGIKWHKGDHRPLLEKMANSIKHEKWHRVEAYCDSFFGAARVSPGIFNPEPQPVFNEERSLCIFMYGKIYGNEEALNDLKRKKHLLKVGNDADFLLHSYEEYGEDFLEHLNGSFVFVIYDMKRKKIMLFSDRFGSRPLYFAKTQRKFLFASEVKAILEDEGLSRKLNYCAIADFFSFGEIWGDKTFFQEVHALPAGSILIYENDSIRIKQYWDFHYEPNYKLSEQDILHQLVSAFRKAVNIRLNDNLRPGIALSGGLDSRTVLAGTDIGKRQRLIAFTFGLPGCDDIRIAQMVAQEMGLEHLIFELDADELIPFGEKAVYLTDGFDTIASGFIPIAYPRIKPYVDIILSGFILDTSVANKWSSPRIVKARNDKELSNILYCKWRFFTDKDLRKLFSDEYSNNFVDYSLASFRTEFNKIGATHPGNKSDFFELRNHARRFAIMGHVMLRNILEDANPGLDNDFLQVAFSIPPELRLNYRIYRKFLKSLSPELAAIPYANTMVCPEAPLLAWKMGKMYQGVKDRVKRKIAYYTGGKIVLRSTRSFVDIGEWMRLSAKWNTFTKKLLLDSTSCSKDFFNRDYVESLILEHEKRKANNTRRLLYLMTFELFLRRFVADYPQIKGAT